MTALPDVKKFWIRNKFSEVGFIPFNEINIIIVPFIGNIVSGNNLLSHDLQKYVIFLVKYPHFYLCSSLHNIRSIIQNWI